MQASFGTTFVYITHDQSEALVLSDHVAVMNAGRFEQVGTPQALYYHPATPFVASFVGENNRIVGTVAGADGDIAEVVTASGLKVRARREDTLATGDAAALFIRPESIVLARAPSGIPSSMQQFGGEVESLLFDGANSAVLLRETASRLTLRIALPQSGAFADLVPGERVFFGFEPVRAVCFRSDR